MIIKKIVTRGFTLMEIITALVILALVAIPLFMVYSQTMDTVAYTEDELKAFSIAQREIERMKSWNSINKKSLDELSIIVKAETSAALKVEKGTKFKYYREIEPLVKLNPSDFSPELMNAKVGKISATVLWKDRHGKSRKLALRCFVEKKYY